jgi:hypothetical protein
MTIQFISIDPRPASKASQLDMLEQLKSEGYNIIGFEATLPWLDEVCTYNFDPQHKHGNADLACIEQILEVVRVDDHGECRVAMGNVAMVTVRPDLDSIGGMAVYLAAMRSDSDYMEFHFPTQRVEAVADADKFTQGEWKSRPLFEGNDSGDLAPIARFVSDFKVPMQKRVEGMLKWLEHGTEPDASYRSSYEAERTQIQSAVESGETKLSVIDLDDVVGPQVAVVESTLRAATSIGYSKAPVVVAINPAFSFGGGQPHRKVTICQYGPIYINLKGVFALLGEGWGGSPTIGGSPQGVDCKTSVEEIIEAIAMVLR